MEKEKEQKWINYIREYCLIDDTEIGDLENSHLEADKALTLFLLELGYPELVAEWEKVQKWYA